MSGDDLTLPILRQIQTELVEIRSKLGEHDKRFDTLDARLGRVEVEGRSVKAAVSRNTVLLEATMELVAQLKAGRTVTDVSIRHHEAELQEIRERLARLEENA
jgi:predicted  nucleic acid-binding Zn-ribbon protein